MLTFLPPALSQIGAGSTLHPFITTAPDDPPPPLERFCDEQPAIDIERKAGKRASTEGI